MEELWCNEMVNDLICKSQWKMEANRLDYSTQYMNEMIYDLIFKGQCKMEIGCLDVQYISYEWNDKRFNFQNSMQNGSSVLIYNTQHMNEMINDLIFESQFKLEMQCSQLKYSKVLSTVMGL